MCVCVCLSLYMYLIAPSTHRHTDTQTHRHGIVLRLVVHAIAHIDARTCSRQGQAPLNRLETCCRRLPCRRRRRRLRSRQYAAQQATYSMMSSALRPHCCQYEWDSRAQPVGMGGVHYTLHTAHCTLHTTPLMDFSSKSTIDYYRTLLWQELEAFGFANQ